MKKGLLLFVVLAALGINTMQAQTQYATKVIDYQPAPAQFINTLTSAYEEGYTKKQVIAKAQEGVVKRGLITLGAFGGYIVVGFDHTIANSRGGYDFKVLGNGFEGSSEPGIVMVSADVNHNGIADDEWYELAGSEYNSTATVKDYEVTYTRPNPDGDVKWTDNKGGTGFVHKNSFHNQPYYPAWIVEDSYTLKGNKLANNATNTGTDDQPYWVLSSYPWGYADNASNNTEQSNFKIDWAVDKYGNKVLLKGIDFVKVYTAVQEEAGWLGETSTEFTTVQDLHPSAALPVIDYAQGHFIINEGGGKDINGSVNFINNEGQILYRAYETENQARLGKTTETATVFGDFIYLISKQGNRLVTVDRKTLKKVAVIPELGGADGRSFMGYDQTTGYVGTSKGIYLYNITNHTLGALISDANAIGTMLKAGDYVFALQAKKVLVLKNHAIHKTIEGSDYSYMVQSKDGNIWIGTKTGLLKVNPSTLAEENITLPKEALIVANWGSWNKGSMCASTTTNTLYWAAGQWSQKSIYRYEIGNDASLNTPFYTLPADSKHSLYGAGINIDPITNNLLLTTVQDGWGTNYLLNKIWTIKPSGELLSCDQLQDQYWFPAMMLFQPSNKEDGSGIETNNTADSNRIAYANNGNLVIDNCKDTQLTLSTISGQTIDTFTIDSDHASFSISVSKGIYLLYGISGNKTITLKVIIK
ncbi:MAG: DUF5074 domain-containing protein [Bacteroides sp.]